MKTWIVCASALMLAAACSSSKEANAALEAMNLADGSSGLVHYASKSGFGDKITLKDVVVGPGQGEGLKAKSMVLDGLDVTADGKPLVTSITLNGITPEQAVPGLTFDLKSISITNASQPVAQFMASAFTKEGPGTPPPFEQWQFGKVSVNGLKVAGDLAAMGAGAGSFNVTLDEISASNLKDMIVGGAKFAGLKGDFNVPAEAGLGIPLVGKFDFGAGDIKNIRGGIFQTAFQAGFDSAMNPAAAQTLGADVMKAMTSPIDPGYDTLTWTPILIEVSGAKLTTSRIEQRVTRNGEGIATAVQSPRATLAFTADAAGGQVGQMAGVFMNMVGYPTVELYGSGDATFDPATDTTRYTNYNFGLTDGFDLQMKGGFQGVSKAVASLVSSLMSMGSTLSPITPPEVPAVPGEPTAPAEPSTPAEPPAPTPTMPDLSGLAELKVVDLDLTLTDKSIVQKIFNLAPMMGAPDPAAMRNDIVTMLAGMGPDLAQAGIDPTLSNELMAAVADFVKQPGTLHIVLRPPAPVAVAAPGALLTKQSLGFTATHTPGAPAPAAPN